MYPQYLALDAECGLYLRKNGHGNDERFARLFAHVWRSIPRNDRHAMVAHWSNWVPQDDGRLCISLALENLSTLRRDEAVGDCACKGTELKFYARVVDILPEDLVMYVIAHELAHVLQVSQGKRLRPDPHPLGEAVAYASSPAETAADQIALAWGFDGTKLNQWLERNVRWHSFPADPY